MRYRWGSKTSLCILIAGLAIGISGCSGSDKGLAEGGSSATGAPLPEPSGLTPGYEGAPVAGPTTHALNPGTKTTAAKFKIHDGNDATKQRFAPLLDTLGGVDAQAKFYRASVGSKAAADIAVFSFSADQAKSQIFQGQMVSQLVTKAAGSKKVAFQTINGTTFTVAGSKTKAIGLFDGSSAIVVLGASGSKSLDLASGATFAYLAQ